MNVSIWTETPAFSAIVVDASGEYRLTLTLIGAYLNSGGTYHPRMNVYRPFIGWLLCVLLGLGLQFSGAMRWLDRPWIDFEFGVMRAHFQQPAQNDVVLIGIDEDFLRASPEPLTLMHRRLSELFEAVAAGGPRITGLDIVLPEKSFSFLVPAAEPTVDFDRELARGLLKLGAAAPLVIGETWDNANSRFHNIHPTFLAAAGYWVGKSGLTGFDFRGSALVCPDADGVVRQYAGPSCQPDGSSRTLVGQMAEQLERGSSFEGYINYAVGGAFTYLSARQLVAWHKAGDAEKLAALKDKTVLIGAVLDNDDRLRAAVPLAAWEPNNRLVPGMALQAQTLRSILNQGLVQTAPDAVVLALIMAASCLWFGRRTGLKALGLLIFSALLGVMSLVALRATTFLPVGAIVTTGAIALLASATAQGRRYWKERQYLTQTFSGYVSPQVLKGILAGTLAAGKEGKRQHVCVMFSDIRNFTALSENLTAERVVELLSSYFDRMSDIVHRHGGLVDKFMGDGMMTVFGAPKILRYPEKNALEAAHEMLLALDVLNAEFRSGGLPEFRIGIGLHSGEAVIGHVGSKQRHEYTAIGDVVNVAARVCDLPKTLGYPIVCTEAVARALGMPDFLQDAGMQPIKGHADVQVFGWHPQTAPSP